jgi:cytoskeleton protein RodZ
LSEAAHNPVDVVSEVLPAMPVTASVGGQLRAARDAAKLSLDEVAHALKFSPRQIESLETDDYAALPGVTIVRGFVRSYARLLKLDAEALLRQLEAALPSGPIDVRPPDNMGIASQPRGLREISPVVAVALVLLLAAGLLVVWHFFGPAAPRTTTVSGQLETPQAQDPAPAAANAPLAAPAALLAGENAMPPQAKLQNDAVVPTLHFGFADRAWVEVTDASRQLLHSGENPAGSQLTLTGRPPFDIVIGNASKVTLTYGEKPVDLAPYMRAEVARFTLE